jgi:S1-C subfamily serine protease
MVARRRQERDVNNRNISGALAFVIAGAIGGASVAYELRPQPATTALTSPLGSQALPVQPQAPGGDSGGSDDGGSTDAATIARNVDPGIVDINTTIGYGNGRAAGTGMVLSTSGEVLTNNHVISGATSISVTDVGNSKTYTATVVGYDKTHDVALLRLQGASGLATITPASEPVQVGAGVVGVGNAGGTGGTPSYASGVVSAVEQSITATDSSDSSSEQLTGLIETNANIMAGDSGGPLVDEHGQVVGMNTAASAGFRFSRTSDAYAIPIDDALSIAQQIKSGQASDAVHIGPTAMLGVGVQPGGDGAVIAQVLDGGPAAGAGIVAGDTIVAVAGQSVSSASDLSSVMLQQTPGSNVSVQYVDESGAAHTVTLRLANGPAQ